MFGFDPSAPPTEQEAVAASGPSSVMDIPWMQPDEVAPAVVSSSRADIVFVLRLEKVGYSYACITLAIIVMIPRAETPWIAAAHRFAEVSRWEF
jgi:hypothetical protein